MFCKKPQTGCRTPGWSCTEVNTTPAGLNSPGRTPQQTTVLLSGLLGVLILYIFSHYLHFPHQPTQYRQATQTNHNPTLQRIKYSTDTNWCNISNNAALSQWHQKKSFLTHSTFQLPTYFLGLPHVRIYSPIAERLVSLLRPRIRSVISFSPQQFLLCSFGLLD